MIMEIILENWSAILLGLITFLDLIVSLTPSKKDDQILGYFRVVITALSGKNRRKKSQ